MPNVWAGELRAFLTANETAIAGGEIALPETFRHVIGRQAGFKSMGKVATLAPVEKLGAAVTSDSPPVT